MITVKDARALLFDLAPQMAEETVPLVKALGRVLAHDVSAKRTQPPFAASAMDGYGLRADEVSKGASFRVIGEAAAGSRFIGPVALGQAVRIFTGAPVPDDVGFVVIQEDVDRVGDTITITGDTGDNSNIRPAGGDFAEGQVFAAPKRLGPADIALLASMNIAEVPVTRQPDVTLISTGDELVMPGETPGPDQIIASNTFGLKALFDQAGAQTRILPIARDNVASLKTALDLAKGADLVITIGGASVGDHDLVAQVAADLGLQRAFYKVAMRPGKPLMAGTIDGAMMIGLPGNPVSAMVCGILFAVPVIQAMLGLPAQAPGVRQVELATDISANGSREHYMRAVVSDGLLTPLDNQDSSLLSVLSRANGLLIRPIGDPARPAGHMVDYIPF
ncbi:Molybdopterin molybdenumtransferase [Thalassovita gelatinovora]|uniref:Molybdopterin molybdenumtransferase n=1 Tax=Thalassovita gelatinovora TaxID=53501 RepID=A0A0P1FTJ9_THAGE|nr:molybdopterin molybdotransferase MoeA [Thalassovita gelatinovora]QIZ79356.1 molybdopterin molybdotransferase MoeA [Thalassovita gelatinovora]CUH62640.1 Molybdopterin molybdenumtransferase [Thalassovita gelatinovora]SEQ07713.1 molybdopterin molybdotransferase [Thalassovita gelatinovora]